MKIRKLTPESKEHNEGPKNYCQSCRKVTTSFYDNDTRYFHCRNCGGYGGRT